MKLKTLSKHYAYKLAECMAAHGYIAMVEGKGTYYLVTITEVTKWAKESHKKTLINFAIQSTK